jgi:group II intron reverse transcriptase/maturase
MCETLRNPIDVLRNLSEKSQDKSYRFQRLYRNLYNPEFYYLAYNNIYTAQGNMTAGVDGQTIDGMSTDRIVTIISILKDHSYQPKPVRRTYTEKKGSTKKRPLGILSANDKLIQEVVRMILESIFEPDFSDCSHGFRPNRSCHTALKHIDINFKGVVWFIEGDIKACFDSFDHHVIINQLKKRIDDEYFIALIWKFLKAGYMEQWQYSKTYSGTVQGSGVSPILANIYLDLLDEFILDYKKQYDIGDNKHRKCSHEYNAAKYRYDKAKQKYTTQWKKMSDADKIDALKEIKRYKLETFKYPYLIQCDTKYKRIQYCRYADDFIIGIIGNKTDAEKIKAEIKNFLDQKLKLELSVEKTKITHTSKFARFLGYDITVSRSESFKRNKQGVLKREFKGRVNLYVPREKWVGKLKEYGAIKIVNNKTGKEFWKTIHRGKLINHRDIEIISKYNSEIRGLYNYYAMANNASVIGQFAYFMEYSMYKTYANKYRTTMTKIIRKYKRDGKFLIPYETKAGMKQCEFYSKGFKRIKKAGLEIDTLPVYKKYDRPNSIAARLKRGECELCGVKSESIRMHHVRKLKELKGTSEWEQVMIKMRRKSLTVCRECHDLIHK